MMYLIGQSKGSRQVKDVQLNTAFETIMLNGFEWTPTPPTQEGVYWCRYNKDAEPVIGKVYFGAYTSRGVSGRGWKFWEAGEDYPAVCSEFEGLWLGPLSVPEIPKG